MNWRLSSLLIGSLALYGQRPAVQVGTFTTIDVPGATSTNPSAINAAGVIIGTYCTSSGCLGFVRNTDGTFATLYAPDGSTANPAAINGAGVVTGSFGDEFGTHGFLWKPSGTMTIIDLPGVSSTQPSGINAAGQIVGTYNDSSGSHGFIRAANGTVTTFDASGTGGTSATSINGSGAVSGCYNGQAFVRTAEGTVTLFNPPSSTNSCFPPLFYLSSATHIDAAGDVTGTYTLPSPGGGFSYAYRGFVRAADGTITGFDAATYPPCCDFTYVLAINAGGLIAGTENDGYNINHGYVRLTNGNIITLDAPGAGSYGTVATAINAVGQVTGWYNDTSNVTHGFLWKP